jgi:hypothetical protein
MLRGSIQDILASIEADGNPDDASILNDAIRAIQEVIIQAGPVLQRMYDRRIARILASSSQDSNMEPPVLAVGLDTIAELQNIDPNLMGYNSTDAVELLPLPSPASEASLDLDSFEFDMTN